MTNTYDITDPVKRATAAIDASDLSPGAFHFMHTLIRHMNASGRIVATYFELRAWNRTGSESTIAKHTRECEAKGLLRVQRPNKHDAIEKHKPSRYQVCPELFKRTTETRNVTESSLPQYDTSCTTVGVDITLKGYRPGLNIGETPEGDNSPGSNNVYDLQANRRPQSQSQNLHVNREKNSQPIGVLRPDGKPYICLYNNCYKLLTAEQVDNKSGNCDIHAV